MDKMYSDIKAKLEIVVDKKTTNGLAHLTHYFHNHKNCVSQYFKAFVSEYLAGLHEDINVYPSKLSKIENSNRDFDEKRLSRRLKIFKHDLTELMFIYVTSQFGKQIYETNCTKKLLQIAEEKVKYRMTLNKSNQR